MCPHRTEADTQSRKSRPQHDFNSTITCPLDEYYDQAIGIYSEFLDANPENLTALSGLFHIARCTGRTQQIKHYLRQYLIRRPGDIAIMHCLASIFIMENRLDAAREVLINILNHDTENTHATDLIEEIDHIQAQARIENAKEMWLVQSA